MGRTWQMFGRICLPCGRNLSSGDIAKSDLKFLAEQSPTPKRKWEPIEVRRTPLHSLGVGVKAQQGREGTLRQSRCFSF